MSVHSAVLHCPYCAEEDLRPTEDSHGSWLCASCRRVFAVRLIGISPVDTTRSSTAVPAGHQAGSATPPGSTS
jgi:ribosomal protein L37AE/L43A